MEFIHTVISLFAERKEFFIESFFQHIVLTSIAVIVISLIGIPLGILITTNKNIARVVLSLTSFMYTIPSIALFGFLVTIIGIGNESAIVALSIYGVLPMIRNTYVGITEVDKQTIEVAEAMGSTKLQVLLQVKLPLALPVIMSGFRTMIVMVIALGGIAAFIGAGGLGVVIWRGISTNYAEMTFIGSMLVALLAILTDLLLEFIEKIIRKKVLGKA